MNSNPNFVLQEVGSWLVAAHEELVVPLERLSFGPCITDKFAKVVGVLKGILVHFIINAESFEKLAQTVAFQT